MTSRRRAASVLAFLLAGALSSARADYTTTVDPGSSWGVWDGWGCSLAWWANVFGDRDDLADLIFTRKDVSLGGETLPGLGLNIARYNAGASSWNVINHGRDKMVASPKIPRYKQIEGFWTDWRSTNPASGSWDWSVDARQRAMLLKAKARGVDWFELFSNSPMWWMLKNHNPSGAQDGGDNLQKWNYRDHATYLATIAKVARDEWGVDFASVEPFNEPTGNAVSGYFWKADGSQEGCSLDPATQEAVLPMLREELDRRGLASTGISASDENTYDEAILTWARLGDPARSVVSKVNVHGYEEGGGRRDILYDEVQGRKLWNSEYGDGDASGKHLASNLLLDFRWLHPSAWSYWQPLDATDGWSLVKADFASKRLRGANPKYHVLAQFTRHIRPGMLILDGGEANTVAAYSPDDRRLVIVTANGDDGQWINYDLSRVRSVAGPITRWATNMKGGDAYTRHRDTELHETRFWSWFDPDTVQTFEIENVDLR